MTPRGAAVRRQTIGSTPSCAITSSATCRTSRARHEAEARRRARLELGGLEQAKEACRDVRPLRWAGEFARDVRLGLPRAKRDRLFAASVT